MVAGDELKRRTEQAAAVIDLLDGEFDAAVNRPAGLGADHRQIGIQPDQPWSLVAWLSIGSLLREAQLTGFGEQVVADFKAEFVGEWRHHLAEAEALFRRQGMDGDAGLADGFDQRGFPPGSFLALPDCQFACCLLDDVARLRRQRFKNAPARRKNVAEISMIAQCQVLLHFMKTHADNRHQRIFLPVDRAVGQCLIGGMEIDGNGARFQRFKLIGDDPAFHGPDAQLGEILGAADRRVGGKLLEAVFPESQADQIDGFEFGEQHLAGFAVEHGVKLVATGKIERQIGVLHGRDRRTEFGGGRQDQIERALPRHFQHLIVATQFLIGMNADLHRALAALGDLFGKAQGGGMQGAVGGNIQAEAQLANFRHVGRAVWGFCWGGGR